MSLLGNLKDKLGSNSTKKASDYDMEDLDFDISTEKDVKITQKAEKLADIDVKYPLIKPFAYAHIQWDAEEKEVVYNLEEPNLDEEDQEAFNLIKENLSEKLDVSLSAMKDREKVIGYLEKKIDELLTELGMHLDEKQHKKIMYYIYRDFVGLGKIEPFMHDPYIEDLGCDGTGIPIFAVHSEFGSVKSDVKYEQEQKLKNLVIKLAERAGKYVSYANPLLDGALPDGSRVNASLTEDVTAHGPTFSIRKFKETPFSAINMVDLGTANAEVMAYMWIAEQYQQSYLICGGTATGKTSFLNSIVSFIPPEDKIVSIEDTRELRLPHENWIPSITRSMFGSDSGSDVDMDKLLKESFRENPDYVIVGEVRGEEASVLFQGMSSGHPSIGTMHASGPNDVVKRLVTPPISLSPALVESLDIIIAMTHAKGVENSARRVRDIHEVQKVLGNSQSARTNVVFSWTARNDSHRRRGEPYVFDQISEDYGVSKDKLMEELEQRTKVLQWLKDKGVTEFSEVSEIISEYYKDKESIMKMVNAENSEYSLEDVIDAESRINLSRSNSGLDEDVEPTGSNDLEAAMDVNGDTPIDQKKQVEENPVSDLEKKLRQERKKVENIQERTEEQRDGDESPFKTDEKVEENPFEA
ncbi:type II/IV secretion system ATPase subunit [Candidatus Nanohalococcus occultus]|uniref:Archaeal flagellar protein FlaI n=1 Tax=Candidatus Nanohalococcus occultus TaxID=2978047 RepID=A0ABY8CFH2_9ARCH|nr:Archaeal flagellar protein FlaI [Candidatus Nanohaloarchaeota archaeon SVXNc]